MSKEIKLSDGKLAVIKDGKGLDLLNAQKKAKTSDEIPYALIAELTDCRISIEYFGHSNIAWFILFPITLQYKYLSCFAIFFANSL